MWSPTAWSHGEIRDRICSSHWNTETILLKNFKDNEAKLQSYSLSATDSIVDIVSLWYKHGDSEAVSQILTCLLGGSSVQLMMPMYLESKASASTSWSCSSSKWPVYHRAWCPRWWEPAGMQVVTMTTTGNTCGEFSMCQATCKTHHKMMSFSYDSSQRGVCAMAPANPLSIVLIKIASLQPNFSAAFPAAFSRLAFHHPPPRCVLSCCAGDGGGVLFPEEQTCHTGGEPLAHRH